MATYHALSPMALSRTFLYQAFSLLEQGHIEIFLNKYVDEQVKWTITGTGVLAKTYDNRDVFINEAITRLKKSLVGQITWQIQHFYVDGDTAIVEMCSEALAVKGHRYRNQYVWILNFINNRIVQARVYYDDILVEQTIV